MVAEPALVVRPAEHLVASVIAEQEHEGVVQEVIALEAGQEARQLAVGVAQRGRVAVGVARERGHGGIRRRRYHERVVHAERERGKEVRLPRPPQRLDLPAHLVEQRAVGETQAQPFGRRREVALVEELPHAVAGQEQRRVVLVMVAVVANHHLRRVAGPPQQLGQAEVVGGVPDLDRRLAEAGRVRAQRGEQAVVGQRAVREEVVEDDGVAAPAVEEGRQPWTGEPTVEGLDEDQQDVGAARRARRGGGAGVDQRVLLGGEDRARRYRLPGQRNGLWQRHQRLGPGPRALLVGTEREEHALDGLPDGALGQRVVRRARDADPRGSQRALGLEPGGADDEAQAEQRGGGRRRPRPPRLHGRVHATAEEPPPATDHHGLYQREGAQPQRPLAGVTELGACLLDRLAGAGGGLTLVAGDRRPREHLVDVLEEDAVEVLAVVAVVTHVHGEHEQEGDRHRPAPAAQRGAEPGGGARARGQRQRGRHQRGAGQRDQDAEGGQHQVGPRAGEQRLGQDAGGGPLGARRLLHEEQPLGNLHEEQQHPPEDDRAHQRASFCTAAL